jgi:hypothetical protein
MSTKRLRLAPNAGVMQEQFTKAGRHHCYATSRSLSTNCSFTCSDVASDNTPFSNTSASGSYGRFLMMRFAVALPIPGTSINSSRLAVFRTSAFSFGVGHSLGWIPKAYNIGAVRQEEESPCKPTASERRLRFRLLRSSCLIFAHTSVFESRILRASSSSAKASSAARAPEFGAVGQAGNHRCQPYSGITTSVTNFTLSSMQIPRN